MSPLYTGFTSQLRSPKGQEALHSDDSTRCWGAVSLGAYLSGFVDDVAGPDPVALQVCIEARVQPSSSQPIPRD